MALHFLQWDSPIRLFQDDLLLDPTAGVTISSSHCFLSFVSVDITDRYKRASLVVFVLMSLQRVLLIHLQSWFWATNSKSCCMRLICCENCSSYISNTINKHVRACRNYINKNKFTPLTVKQWRFVSLHNTSFISTCVELTSLLCPKWN